MYGRNVLAHIRHKRAEEKRKAIIDMRKSVAAKVAAQRKAVAVVDEPETPLKESVKSTPRVSEPVKTTPKASEPIKIQPKVGQFKTKKSIGKMDIISPDFSHGKTIQKEIDLSVEVPTFKDKKVQQPLVPKLADFFQPMSP